MAIRETTTLENLTFLFLHNFFDFVEQFSSSVMIMQESCTFRFLLLIMQKSECLAKRTTRTFFKKIVMLVRFVWLLRRCNSKGKTSILYRLENNRSVRIILKLSTE